MASRRILNYPGSCALTVDTSIVGSELLTLKSSSSQ